MAYSTLVSLEKLIDQILNDNRYSISSNGKQHIVSVDKHVISLRSFLEDFPEKAKNLEARIRDVAMKTEDIIELFMNEQIRHYVFRYVHWIAELRRLKFEYKLHKVRDEMDSIAGEVVEIKNSILIKDAKLNDSFGDTSSSSGVADAAGKMKMVGLNEDLIEIMDQLCGDSRQLQILPITGMGGIGKTTLARNAYEDLLIMERFQIRVWITISQDYSEERILSDLLNSMKEFFLERNKGSVAEESNIEKAVKVYQTLSGKRFLIVMDDIWSTKVLDIAKKLFPNDNNGSRILLTTRLGDVANSSTTTSSHEMRLMDEDQSWNLLQEKVLEHHDCIPNELVSIGKEIARSCGGLPLAVVVVAGLLSTVSMSLTSWKEIARNVKLSLLKTEDGQVEKILSLSYNHLPHHLRSCFLYMGGFPQDHEIGVSKLVRLWIAEGFVKPVASKSFEESAQGYIEDLIQRSLVIVVTKSKCKGKIKSCSLHDLVRDLCIKQSQEEKFLVQVKGGRQLKSMMKEERRISISRSDIHSFANISSSTIRTIMYFPYTLLASFGSFRLLRVLDVLRVVFKSNLIPDQYFELFHLRYLAFCYVGHIPKAISNLQSLQTLILKGNNYCGISLPREIWKMRQLRHLFVIHGSFRLADPNLALENLQTLGWVRNLRCSLEILNMISNLKKLSLDYDYLGNGDLLFHNLVHLHALEKLKLKVTYSLGGSGVPNLVLPSSLKKLALIGWGGQEPYLSTDNIGTLPNLQVLKLEKFDFLTREWITHDQDFPKLRILEINECDLTQWHIQGSSPFPVLEKLLIHSCWSLNVIPDSIGEIPTLKLIEVKGCKNSLADCVRLMQEEQQQYSNGEDDGVFQVRCIDCKQSLPASYYYDSYKRELNDRVRKIELEKPKWIKFTYAAWEKMNAPSPRPKKFPRPEPRMY